MKLRRVSITSSLFRFSKHTFMIVVKFHGTSVLIMDLVKKNRNPFNSLNDKSVFIEG